MMPFRLVYYIVCESCMFPEKVCKVSPSDLWNDSGGDWILAAKAQAVCLGIVQLEVREIDVYIGRVSMGQEAGYRCTAT